MLASLKIENIAIIESLEIEFDSGLNVLTGETGAGKSIILDAIHAVMGERTSRELIRSGASSAQVAALFSGCGQALAEILPQLGLEVPPEGELLLQRSLSADGRNVCRVNGAPVSVAMLKAVGRDLINIHGQHDNQALLAAEQHYRFIDSLAGNAALLGEYRSAYEKLLVLQRERETLRMDETEKARMLDMLDFQIQELEAAQLREGEWAELDARRSLLQHAEKVQDCLQNAYAALQGGEESAGALATAGVLAGIETAAENLETAAAYYAEVRAAAEAVREMAYNLDEYAAEIRNAFEAFDFDPREMAELAERLDSLYRLSRKYGATEADMLAFYEDALQRRDGIVLSEARLAALDAEIESARENTLALAERLRESRQQAAALFESGVKAELAFLDMPNVTFLVQMEQTAPGPTGADAMEFLISANVGEEPKPLAKIASGGELSRITLAIKNVLSDKDGVGTLIFDEIDAGVSGHAAQQVALKLREAAGSRQVICVTHLAQIAAQARRHMYIQKEVAGGKTYTGVSLLDREGRKRELARIMGGLKVTELQLQSAEEMLDAAGN